MRVNKALTFMLMIYLSGFLIFATNVPMVKGSTATYTFGFEGCVAGDLQGITAGLPAGSQNIFTSWVYDDSSYDGVVSSTTHTGTRAYRDWGGGTQFNASYSTSKYMNTYKFYLYTYNGALSFYCYNKTTGHLIIRMFWDGYNQKSYYYDEIGTQIQYATFVNGGVWHEVGFQINNTIGDVGYIYDSVIVTGSARNPTYIESGERIDKIVKSTGGQDCRYDDMTWILTDAYGEGVGGGGGSTEGYCGVDVSQYATQIGDMYSVGVWSEKSSTQITSNFGVPMDTTIYGVGLAVDINQYNDDWDASNYTLEINGNDVGGALCFTPFSNTYGSFYVLFWDCDVALLNETPTFSFTHTKISPYGWYWTVGQSAYSQDIDNDGDSYFTYEETSTTYSWQWIRIGGIFVPFWLPTTTTVTGVNADLGMTFWAGEITPPDIIDTNYTNTIGLSNWDYKNDTGYVYTIPKVSQKGIVVSYTIAPENQSYDYGIAINFTNATESGYPFECGDFTASAPIPYPDGVFSCIPTVEGKYEFFMYTVTGAGITFTGVNVTAWVVGSWANETYYIFTNPPTTYQFDSYEVVWKYDHPSDYDGAIAMFDDYYMYQEYGYNGNFLSWDITDSATENSQWYNSWGDSAEWWGLYANKTNGYALTVPLHQHNIKLYGIIENKIWVLPSTLDYPTQDDVGHRAVVIYYQHRFVGTNIAIYIDDIYYASVGDASSGSRTYTPYVAGTHTVKLKLDQNGTLVTVASNTFRVTIAGGDGGGGGGDGGGGAGIIPTLAQPLGSVVGLIITIFCLLTPFIIGGALHIGGIHPVIYAMTGGLGLAISTIMGLFPVWIPLFVVVCGIIVIIIFYLRGATASSE